MKDNERVLATSSEFIDGYTRRKIGNADFPKLLASLLDSYRRTASQHQSARLTEAAGAIEKSLDSPRSAQKAHRQYLLALQEIVLKQ